jgi:hypothetical protein
MLPKFVRRTIAFSVVVAAMFLVAYTAYAASVLSNAPFPESSYASCIGTQFSGRDMLTALRFQTDSSGSYRLDSVSTKWVVNHTIDITLALHADGGGVPGAAIATIGTQHVAISSGFVIVTLNFVPGSPITLNPSTHYWLVGSALSPDVWCPAGWQFHTNAPSGIYTYIGSKQFFDGAWRDAANPLSIDISATLLHGEDVPNNPGQGGEHSNPRACEQNPGQANQHRPGNVPPCRD